MRDSYIQDFIICSYSIVVLYLLPGFNDIFYIFIKSLNMGIVSFLEENMLSCQWKKLGVECTGCGMQRAIIHLLKGEFVEALIMYPAIYTLIVMLLFLGIHLKFNFVKGHVILKWLFIVNIVIIITSYIIKII